MAQNIIGPLTLEQLREKRGKWVWIISPDEHMTVEAWAYVGESQVFTYWEYQEDKIVGRVVYNMCDYGAWLAYAYPPAHIDREEWTAEWIYPGNEWNLPVCSKCGCNSKDATYGHKDNFCPKCGRAMTPEARAELEKRLRG